MGLSGLSAQLVKHSSHYLGSEMYVSADRGHLSVVLMSLFPACTLGWHGLGVPAFIEDGLSYLFYTVVILYYFKK